MTPLVHHHAALARFGGAAAMAARLAEAQLAAGYAVSRSCEIREPGRDITVLAPADLPPQGLDGGILHLHGSTDPDAALSALAARAAPFFPAPETRGAKEPATPHAPPGPRVVVTVHDCQIITGGCVFPMDCPAWAEGCPDPCPRRFPDARSRRAGRAAALAAMRPLLAAPSGWMAELLRQALPDLPVKVIPNGAPWPDALMPKTEAKSRLGLHASAKPVLFLAHGGAQAAYKGGDFLAGLFARLKAADPHILPIIAGGDDHRLTPEALYLPYLEGPHLSLALRAADLLLYPTLADNHPLVILEAMAHALPVAAYATGGIPEQIIHGETGLLAPTGDESALLRGALFLLRNPARARTMAETARARGKDRFATERMARDYEKAYAATA